MCRQVTAPEVELSLSEHAAIQKEMREVVKGHVMKDINAKRNEWLFTPPGIIDRPLRALIKDQRDAPILYLFFNIASLTFPAAFALFMLPASHLLGVIFLVANQIYFLPRFILAMHYATHRTLFDKSKGGWMLNHLPHHVTCMFFGIPPGMYKLHHTIMHHMENNASYDISTTEPYQRDSVLHFIHYLFKYMIGAWIELPYYAFKRGRYSHGLQVMTSAVLYFAMLNFLYTHKPVQTTWIFIVPFFVTSLALMLGNWAQHAFVDPNRPESNYLLTYNCINVIDNTFCFNDGYHIIHHANSKTHWTDMPQRFLDTIDKHAEEDAICLRGMAGHEVALRLFAGKYESLADRWLDLSSPAHTREEKVQIIKDRLKPIVRKTKSS